MGGKVLNTGIVIFWAVMMAALIRVEFFPRHNRQLPVAMDQVLSRLLNNNEPARLDVVYQDQKIGVCRVGVAPLTDPPGGEVPAHNAAVAPLGYLVEGTATLNLMVFNAPSRFRLVGKLWLDAARQLRRFEVQTYVGASHVAVAGDTETRQLELAYDTVGGVERRWLNYGDADAGAQLLQALGWSELPGLPAWVAWPGGGADRQWPQWPGAATTRAYRDIIRINGLDQRVYLVQTVWDEALNLWAKMWIDEEGNVLRVDTSLGIALRSDRVDFGESRPVVDRLFEQRRRP